MTLNVYLTSEFNGNFWNSGRTSVSNFTNQTVNDGVAHSKNPRKFAYHVTFDLDLEHILEAS